MTLSRCLGALLILHWLTLSSSFAVLTNIAMPQGTLSLNGEWQFQWQQIISPESATSPLDIQPESDFWEQIQVPGDWEHAGFHSESLGLPSISVGLYRRTFSLPPAWNERVIFASFAGVMQTFQVGWMGILL